MNKVGNKKVSFCRVLYDMLKLIGGRFWILVLGLFLVLLFLTLRYQIDFCSECFIKTIIEIIPELLGFLIAGLAIVMGFNDGTLKRLSITADDGMIPIRVVVASFSVCFIILLLTLVLSVFYVNIDFCCLGCRRLLGFLVIWLAITSALSLFHVIFHLFAISTHLIIK
ncbi:MAG: hypothetical protein IKX44_07505 [Prevotella sp.]|nr:hypothetical protein [Prevotella sp.]